MYVIVQLKNGENRKAIIRNQIFHEVDANNRKIESIKTANIASVLWPQKGDNGKFAIENIPVAQFVEMAESNDYWNLN